jgi:hypothetical protein
MEEQLKHLKESMDNTILKPGLVTPFQKQKLLEGVLNGNKKPIRNHYVTPVLSVAFTLMLTIGLGTLIYKNIEEPSTSAKPKSTHLSQGSFTKQPDNKVQDNKEFTPNFPYIVFNGYYYKETSEKTDSAQLGKEVGKVNRTGDWAIKKEGDSNEVPPGPVFSIEGKDSSRYIAVKNPRENGGKLNYVIFEKAEKIIPTDTSEIETAKNDPTEVNAAIQNATKGVGPLFTLDEKYQPISFSYTNEQVIQLAYKIPEGDKVINGDNVPGELYIDEYEKNIEIKKSRFIKPVESTIVKKGNHYKAVPKKVTNWSPPTLIKSSIINNVKWGFYKDEYHKDIVVKGETDKYNFEITTQGSFSLELLERILKDFKETN